MIGRSRPPGRHRAGQAYTPVYRRVWDGPARAEAERLERSCPGWLVWYGPGSRRFYAVAAWPAPHGLIVDAAGAEKLQERMAAAETAALLHFPPSAPSSGLALTVSPDRARRRSRRRAAPLSDTLPYPPRTPPRPPRPLPPGAPPLLPPGPPAAPVRTPS